MIFWNSHTKEAHIGSSHSPTLTSCLKIKLILHQGKYDHVHDVFFSHRPLFRNGWTVGWSVGEKKGKRKKRVITWAWYQAVQAEKQVVSLEIPEFITTNMQRKRRQNYSFNIKQLHFFQVVTSPARRNVWMPIIGIV